MRTSGLMRTAVLVSVVSLVLVACDGEAEPELTTTSSLVGQTTAPETDSTTTTVGEGESTTTTLVGEPVDSFDVVLRESTDEGETLYIVIPPGEYTSVDLENFVGDLVDEDEDVESAEIFDDQAALEAFLLDESEQTAADLALIDEHHLVSLIDGTRIRFQGPYAEFGEYAIGS